MTLLGSVRIRDEVILVARILLVVIFVVFGWNKFTNYTGTVGYMALIDAPMPYVVALMAIVVEIFVTLAIALGAWTRPLATARALHIGDRAYRAPLLDDGGHGPIRARSQLLQEPQHRRRSSPALRHRRGQVLDRWTLDRADL